MKTLKRITGLALWNFGLVLGILLLWRAVGAGAPPAPVATERPQTEIAAVPEVPGVSSSSGILANRARTPRSTPNTVPTSPSASTAPGRPSNTQTAPPPSLQPTQPAPQPQPQPQPNPSPQPAPPPDNRCLVTIQGKRYDVTQFRSMHSGGDIFVCASDMTGVFFSQHNQALLDTTMRQFLVP